MLKARETAVGRTRKCPVCAARVTCPGPGRAVDADIVDADIVDADIVDAEIIAVAAPAADRQAVDPYADLDDGGTYEVAGTAAGEDSPIEARRPCPMCGETILASAIKCRFCGEVFDPVLKKGKGKGKKPRKRSSRRSGDTNLAAGRHLMIGILLMIAGIGLTALSYANPRQETSGRGTYFMVYYGLIFGGIGGIIQGIYGMVRSD
jgi:hypothetical protein